MGEERKRRKREGCNMKLGDQPLPYGYMLFAILLTLTDAIVHDN